MHCETQSILRQHAAHVFSVPNVGLQGAALRPSGAVLSVLAVHRGRALPNRDGMPSFRTAPVAAAGQAIPPGTRPCRLCFVGAASPPLSCSRKPSGPARGRAIRRRPPILLAPCPGAEPPTFYLPPGRGPAPRGDFPAFPQCLLPGALNSRRAQSGGLHPL